MTQAAQKQSAFSVAAACLEDQERDLLNHDVILQKYRMFDNLNDAFNFAIKLKDNNDVENLEIRFY